ncbi:hypothetical protein AAHN97_16605 [Chitinophaga niabensis]|uniref:hypothetical protein n=1 Tax=Chitinophaga niabensis TaxID=536979 RepID=UPI0031BBA04C
MICRNPAALQRADVFLFSGDACFLTGTAFSTEQRFFKKIRLTANVFNILDEYLYSGADYGSFYYWQAEAPRDIGSV